MIGEHQNWLARRGIVLLIRAIFWPDSKLTAEESASTLFRFFRSEHVRDLKLIVALIAFLFALLACAVFSIAWARFGLHSHTTSLTDFVTYFAAKKDLFEFLAKYLGPAIGVTGLVIAWAYRSAAARLGVVDLFACEISTLCRVGTIVDVGERYVNAYEKRVKRVDGSQKDLDKPAARSNGFVAQEEYFPVFENNAKDLELLEALVVTNITQFYRYMKATRDSQRSLAQTGSFDTEDGGLDPALNLVYMLFLGYESGRKAVEHLIEYQPSRAENRIVILITELRCFCCLLNNLRQDRHHYPRLLLRVEEYKRLAPKLFHDVIRVSHGKNERDWVQARTIMPELSRRYREAFNEEIEAAVTRLHPEITTQVASA